MTNQPRTPICIHKAFARNLAYGDQIFWDLYTPDQYQHFRGKINELFRDPDPECTTVATKESNKTDKEKPKEPADSNKKDEDKKPEPADCNKKDDDKKPADSNQKNEDKNPKNSKAHKAMEKIRLTVYNQTISQTKYTNKMLLSTFILVTVAEGNSYLEARDSTKYSVHLLVRTRKCQKDDDSSGCCMVFIDEHGKVYKNWKHFMENNSLPAGWAFAPKNGVYTYKNEELVIDSWETPATKLGSKITNFADKAASVTGICAAGVSLGALGCAALVPAAAAAGAACIGTGVYAASRSVWQLWSRTDHEQTVSVVDSEARGHWLGVASGAFAISSTIANRALAQAVLAGREVTLVREVVVNGMNISTMLLSGTGVANGILDLFLKYSDDEEISALDVLQVAASLAIFTHSVYNFRLASTIVSQTQDAKLSTYRSELSNRQRKMFDKLTKETLRTRGAGKGKTDVIRLINEVPDNKYLNDMHKINKDLNKNNVRFSAGTDGQVLLNEDVSVKTSVLRDSVQHGKGENILGKVSQTIPENHQTIPNQRTVSLLTQNAFTGSSSDLAAYCQAVLSVAPQFILQLDSFQNCVRYLLDHLKEPIVKFLITTAKDFLDKFRSRIQAYINCAIYIEKVLWDLYKMYEEKLVNYTLESLQEKIEMIFEMLLLHYEAMTCNNTSATKVLCKECNGYYSICPI